MAISKVFYPLHQILFHGVSKLKVSLLTFIFMLTMYNSFAQLSIVNSEVRMVEIPNNQVNGICVIAISDTTICSVIAIELSVY